MTLTHNGSANKTIYVKTSAVSTYGERSITLKLNNGIKRKINFTVMYPDY
jgi:hypothetical protein